MKKLAALVAVAALASACGSLSSSAPSPMPQPSATVPSTPSPTPVSADPERAVVYLARDRLPPVAWPSADSGVGATGELRVRSRVERLFTTVAPPSWDPPLVNVVPLSSARLASVRIDGDLAVVDFTVPNDDWSLGGSAMLKAFVQQLIYTASEEPGIRRVLITQNGGRMAIIGGEGLMIDGPRSREQVAGYMTPGTPGEVGSDGEVVPAGASFGFSVEQDAVGLVRVKIELQRSAGEGPWVPSFTVTVTANDEMSDPKRGKWILTLDVPGVTDVARKGIVVETQYRPLRWLATVPTETGTRYLVGLDELRPWRTAVLRDPVAIVVDLGGDPDAVVINTAVYAPRWGGSVERAFRVSGVARAFEANVQWRVKDPAGGILAQGFTTATLGTSIVWGAFEVDIALPASTGDNVEVEVFQLSPRDGAEVDLVRIPVTIRWRLPRRASCDEVTLGR